MVVEFRISFLDKDVCETYPYMAVEINATIDL